MKNTLLPLLYYYPFPLPMINLYSTSQGVTCAHVWVRPPGWHQKELQMVQAGSHMSTLQKARNTLTSVFLTSQYFLGPSPM